MIIARFAGPAKYIALFRATFFFTYIWIVYFQWRSMTLLLMLYFVFILNDMFFVHNDIMRKILVVLLLLENKIKMKEQRKK